MTIMNILSIIKVVIITKEVKYKEGVDYPVILAQSYIITFHSSPVAILSKAIIALSKLKKFVYSSITSPSLTSWNKNTPSIAKIKKSRSNKDNTFITAGKDSSKMFIKS